MAKEYQYYFRPLAEGAAQDERPRWQISKFLDGEDAPENTYTVELAGLKTQNRYWRCNCPAWGRKGDFKCKHTNWLQRYLKIREEHPNLANTPIYYDPGDDGFFPEEGMDMSSIVNLSNTPDSEG